MNMLRQVVQMTGKESELIVFSYSVTDGWLRQLMKLTSDFHIQKTILVLDRDVMVRHREKITQIERIATECYLTDSHAKLYFSRGKQRTIAVLTSANATQNYRNECYYATDRPEEIRRIESDIAAILSAAVRIV